MKSSFYTPARWAFALLVAISIFGGGLLLRARQLLGFGSPQTNGRF